MTRDELLTALFPGGCKVKDGPAGTFDGTATLDKIGEVAVIGIGGNTPLGVDGAIYLAGLVLGVVKEGKGRPIVMLVDTASQNMARRDELLGLNEYLAHLAKSFALATRSGNRAVSILYGHAAAGAFIATSLAPDTLVVLPGAEPSVMDLPSISRVTKLPIEQLTQLAKTTPIFAPGVDPLYAIGAVTDRWPGDKSVAARLVSLLAQPADKTDKRDVTGLERKGRLRAHAITERVMAEAARA